MIATVDPGTKSVGMAVWSPAWVKRPTEAPLFTELVRATKHSDWLNRSREIGWKIGQYFRYYKVKQAYIELPMFFGESAGGYAAAATGSLVKLSLGAGVIVGSFPEDVEAVPISVTEWKGQLPKSVVELRVRQVLGAAACAGFEADVWDAVGMGLALKGAINKDVQRKNLAR